MSKQSTRQPSKHERRRDRREEQRRIEEARRKRATRNRIMLWGSIIVALLVIIGAVVYFNSASKTSSAQTLPPPEFAQYPNIDNKVACDQQEHNDFHVHAHMTIYINGKQVTMPANTGIAVDQSAGSVTCYYWLHTHDTSGVIHIEAPGQNDFALGNFLDVWGQQFSQLGYPSQLGLTSGWTAYVNGQLYKGDFRSIPLQAHTLITLAYNSPNVKPDTTYNWGNL